MRQQLNGPTIFLRPNGSILQAVPALPVSLAKLDVHSLSPHELPVWDGTPFNLTYAIDVLYSPQATGASAESHGRAG